MTEVLDETVGLESVVLGSTSNNLGIESDAFYSGVLDRSLDRMKEDICTYLQEEIHVGFANLLVALSSEIQSGHISEEQHFDTDRSIPTVSRNQQEHVSETRYFDLDKGTPSNCENQPGPFLKSGLGMAPKRFDTEESNPTISEEQPDLTEGQVKSLPSEVKKQKSAEKSWVLSLSQERGSLRLPCITDLRRSIGATLPPFVRSIPSLQKRNLRSAATAVIYRQENTIASSVKTSIVAMRNRSLKDGDFPDNCLVRLVLSKFFTVLSIFVIILNSVWLGFECDAQIGQQSEQLKSRLYVINLVFTVWFIIELLLRIAALKKFFIVGHDWAWNLLDFALVLFSLPTLLAPGMNLSFFRLVRLAKISRAVRLIRLVKFVTSLREILFSLFYTLGSLFWCFVAFALISYLFALVFMQWRINLEQDGVQYSDAVTDNFKDTWHTMLALFSMISGGQDWYNMVHDFDKHSDVLSKYSLVFYIFFMQFGVINVIIGVFCAKATDASLADEHLRTARHEEQMAKRINALMQVYQEVDTNSRGRIAQKEFEEHFKNPRARWILQSLGLELLDIDKIWKLLLSYDGCSDGSVDLPAFVIGMMRLSGESRNTDIVMLTMQMEDIQAALLRNEHEIHKLSSGWRSRPVLHNSGPAPSTNSSARGLGSGQNTLTKGYSNQRLT